MMELPVTVDDLADRLGLPAGSTGDLAQHLDAAQAILCYRGLDPLKALRNPGLHKECLLQLAVKVHETSQRGMAPMYGADGEYLASTAQATGGMWKSVAALAGPLLKRGGITVG